MAIAAAEKSGRITAGRVLIITADAATIDPAAYGITHATAYLWPDDLERLAPMMRQIPVVVSLNHPIPGRQATHTAGSVYVYEAITQPVNISVPIVIQRPVYTGGIQVVD